MKKLVYAIILSAIVINAAQAKTVYVTDDLELTLRVAENERSKILRMLRSGTPLTLIEDLSSGYSYVRTNKGIEGYILTRFLKTSPPDSHLLEQANKKIEQLQNDNAGLKSELTSLQETVKSSETLMAERNQLMMELAEIKQISSSAIDIKNQRDQFQERVVSAERELQQLKRENQALRDNAHQDWFLYGGILALGGVLLGFILPKLSLGRRTSSWDTF
ncbi:TIGR04211 family SH3 domain-containing protein [Methylotuvimicrobium sp. KM1]|uniref:TIGR04211 family SH3 domain-containing protein n=1 Tax=unclassified Methylotuvimicrobium TaxID=2822412 RepID=UPI00384C77AC